MNKKPRIAFCFSWQARTLDQTYLFFQKNLFDAAKEQWFDYDVFCAVEDDEDADKVKLLNPTKVEKIKSSDVEKIIEDRFWKFIENKIYIYAYNVHRWFYNDLQQFYKVQRSISMVKNRVYKLIVKLRFDIIFLNKLDFKIIMKNMKRWLIFNNNYYTNTTLMSKISHRFIYSYSKICDFFCIWWNDMKIFFNFFDSFEDVIKNHKTYKFLEPAYKIVRKIKRKVDVFNEHHAKIYIPTTPINLLAKLFWLQLFVGESYYYKFCMINDIKLYKTGISVILLKQKLSDSLVILQEKTCFEL